MFRQTRPVAGNRGERSAVDRRDGAYARPARAERFRRRMRGHEPRTDDLAAQLFKGERPADLQFEQPTRCPFVVNLKTAKPPASSGRRTSWRLPTR
jgi:hypothetical protein